MPLATLRARAAAVLLFAAALVGCDTTDPVPPSEPDGGAGVY